MDVTLLGIVTLERLEQLSKAKTPIVVTLFGILTLERLEHPEKAP